MSDTFKGDDIESGTLPGGKTFTLKQVILHEQGGKSSPAVTSRSALQLDLLATFGEFVGTVRFFLSAP